MPTHAVLVQAACSEARQALQDAREGEKAVPQCRSRRFRHFELRGLNDLKKISRSTNLFGGDGGDMKHIQL